MILDKYDVILFDLDGTLLDTSPGIFGSVRFAEKSMGLTPIPDEQLRSFVGPPPKESYMKNYGLSEADAAAATDYHRQYGSEHGVYEATVYDGIPEWLDKLKKAGKLLGVCTLKRQDIAENVLRNFGMYDCLDVIFGIDQGESLTKADTIDLALKKVNCTDKSKVVLIGDSMYDAEGAENAGIDFIGVTYGFGLSKDKSYPFCVCDTIDEMLK